MKDNPPMFDDYMANAGNGGKYDFKTTNGINAVQKGINPYRGMPVFKSRGGQTIYSSARDFGNIAAGYVAGANGMPWGAARVAFDAYQSKVNNWHPTIEGLSTRNAEYYGWLIGSSVYPTRKAFNLRESINSGLRSLWNRLFK
jgi:hypothetical protein